MKYLLLLVLMFCPLFAEETKEDTTQPTKDERLILFQLQRDFLQADAQQQRMARALDDKAKEISAKYKCATWNADFTCVVEPLKEPVKETK